MAVTSLVWLKNDLRLHDNEVIFKAVQLSDFVIPVYCIDPRVINGQQYGIPKMGIFRKRFLKETLLSFCHDLAKLGSQCIVRVGSPESILPQILQEVKAQHLFTSIELAPEELLVQQVVLDAIEGLEVTFHGIDTASLFKQEHLPFTSQQAPEVFTEFRKRVEKHCAMPALIPTPDRIPFPNRSIASDDWLQSLETPGISLEPRSAFPFKGGEQAALQRMNDYILESRNIQNYKQTRNQLIGTEYSSKFSAWLANGSLSARRIYHSIRQYENTYGGNESTYWLFFELLWRDFFRCMFRKYPLSFFQARGIEKRIPHAMTTNPRAFQHWCQGVTGHDFIDANMRELNATGFMSNRGRQVVASYLCHDLQVDWRWGARYFEQQLIDYDVCSNWCNWAYVAGVGNDPRPDRYFNPNRQAEVYDTLSTYRQLWLR